MAILVKVWVIFCSSLTNQGCKSDTLVPIMSHEKCHKTGNTRHFFLQNENCIQNYSIPCQKSRYPSKIKDFRLCIHVRIYNIKEDFHHSRKRVYHPLAEWYIIRPKVWISSRQSRVYHQVEDLYKGNGS